MTLQTLQNFYKTTVATAWATGTGNRYVTTLPTPSAGRLVINPSNTSKREIISYTATGTDGGGNYITVSARGVGGTTDQTHAVGEPVRLNLTAQHYSDIQTELDLKLDDTDLDTDGTLAANSDSKIATQKATKTYADAIQADVDTKVSLTGNETVAGIKTFSSSPVVPTGGTGTQAANHTDIANAVTGASGTATNSTYGTVKLSVAAASAPAPIAVGDNDPRVPTQAENDALAGTGTPSSSNKYVTEDTLASATSKFGGGSDGDVTISTPTTLTRDMYYDDLTVNSTLTTNGYKIFVNGTLSGNGTIKWGVPNPGGNASGTTAGTGGAANSSGGTFYLNAAGGNGTNNTSNGSAGSSVTTAIGSAGGAGGEGGGSGSGGAGGTVTAPTTKFGVFADLTLKGIDFVPATPGFGAIYKSSGGGGGGKGGFNSGAGGGGGAGGGIVWIWANVWAGTFTIDASGAAGGNGSTTFNGGGGGGGGGVTIVIYNTKTWTGSYNVAGGAAGTQTSGVAASAGSTGVSYEIAITSLTR